MKWLKLVKTNEKDVRNHFKISKYYFVIQF